MSDPIADMLTRIRNAGKAKHNSVDIPGSKIKTEIAKVLKESGYIRNYKFISDGKQGVLACVSQIHRWTESTRLSVSNGLASPAADLISTQGR